jgi:hypothetical protein
MMPARRSHRHNALRNARSLPTIPIRHEGALTMPNITMLDIEELKKTKLKPHIEKCLENRAPDPGFHAMMGHNIDLCEAMFVAWDTIFNTGRVSHTLKEVIRVQLSRMASCVY